MIIRLHILPTAQQLLLIFLTLVFQPPHQSDLWASTAGHWSSHCWCTHSISSCNTWFSYQIELLQIKRGHLHSFPDLTLLFATCYWPKILLQPPWDTWLRYRKIYAQQSHNYQSNAPYLFFSHQNHHQMMSISTLLRFQPSTQMIWALPSQVYRIMLAHHICSNSIFIEAFKKKSDDGLPPSLRHHSKIEYTW